MERSGLDVVVLRRANYGLSTAAYARKLRERLPDDTVHHARTPAEERRLIESADVATGPGIDGALLERAECLRLFAVVWSGYDHLPTETLADRGVVVTNAAGVAAPTIAEQTVGYLLAFGRELFEARRRQYRREWRNFHPEEFRGDTVTVVGLGAIGRAVVDRLEGFGVDTVGVRYTPEKGGPTDEVVGFDQPAFHDALAKTDHLVVACRLSETTRGLIDAAALGTLPPDATVVNVARGPVVDTEALVTALQSNEIGAAALDVTDPEPLPADHPLWGFENVLVTPHNAGYTPARWERLADLVAHNVDRLRSADYGDLRNVVRNPDGTL
ncbi:MAG: D-2-hydroxyacid dehydrogenase [Halobaculum sp.]